MIEEITETEERVTRRSVLRISCEAGAEEETAVLLDQSMEEETIGMVDESVGEQTTVVSDKSLDEVSCESEVVEDDGWETKRKVTCCFAYKTKR